MTTDFRARLEALPHDRRDPHPFYALYLDRSVPLDEEAKAAVLVGMMTRCRQFALPVLRPLARCLVVLIQLVKLVVPRSAAPHLLHKLLHRGLKWFVHPQANHLILRHFHIGSELLGFIRANVPGLALTMDPLRPRTIADVEDDLFLRHDLNLFNFVIGLNQELRAQGRELAPAAVIDFSGITDGEFPIAPLPARWHNFIDLDTAIPAVQPSLTDHDFWRAANSLQLDETIAIYVATIRGDPHQLWLVNNGHPLVPLTTLRAGFRLVLHGLSAECLHHQLRLLKRQALAAAVTPPAATPPPAPAAVAPEAAAQA